MRTGKLSICRGRELGETAAPATRLSLVPRESPDPDFAPVAVAQRTPPPAFAPAAPVSPEYHFVHDRLAAMERLARLHAAGVLSDEEFAGEKAIILGLPADELILHHCAPEPAEALEAAAPGGSDHRPSLVGRLLGWKLVPIGLVLGLGLSYASQPQQTLRFFDEALRLFGA